MKRGFDYVAPTIGESLEHVVLDELIGPECRVTIKAAAPLDYEERANLERFFLNLAEGMARGEPFDEVMRRLQLQASIKHGRIEGPEDLRN